MVTIVLLKEAWTCATASTTTRFAFFLTFFCLLAALAIMFSLVYRLIGRRGPLRVRALVLVR